MTPRALLRSLLLALVTLGLAALPVLAQVSASGSLGGVVTDPSHAAIPGASITVTGVGTGIHLTASSDAQGHFLIANVAPGEYTVSVSAHGFQTGNYQQVSVVANQIYNLAATLKVGTQTQAVTVEAGQSILHTEQTSINTAITGKVITQLPSASGVSSLYELTQTNPAIQTMGAPRQSSAEGLPGGAINITIDGISAQWQSGKSGDPIFTMISPNVSDTAEFDVTSAAGSANQTGEGAVQINITSKRGTNQWHGSLFDYFRNDALNANNYFNNLAGQPRPFLQFNQWGGSIGGPILKNKLFFFFDWSQFITPDSATQTPTILTQDAANGLFSYNPSTPQPATPNAWTSCSGSGATQVCKANLLTMVNTQVAGENVTADPFMATTLSNMLKSASAPGVTVATPPSLYQESLAFPSTGSFKQQNPDFRLDYNINQNNSLEFDYHMSRLIIYPDNLNGGGPTYAIAPYQANQYGYGADRAIWATAWRWAVTPDSSNELRVGFQNSPSSFNYKQTAALYPQISTNLGNILMQPVLPGEVTNPYHRYSPFFEWDNVYQLSDNFAWVNGNHSMNYGLTVSRARYSDLGAGNTVATVNIGLSSQDPAAGAFTSSNLPGIGSADLTAAQDIYAMVAGTVTGYSSNVGFDPAKRAFVTGAPGVDSYHQTDLGFYGQDSWHIRPNLTFTYGLRWQYEGTPVDNYNEYFMTAGGAYAGAYGVSGVGNLFQPGTMSGTAPVFVNDAGKQWYNNWYKGFAPSIGVAWQPQGGWWGNSGNTVFRAGYSIAYDREGLNNFAGIAQGNPGYYGSQQANASSASNAANGFFQAGSVLVNGMSIPDVVQSPTSFTSSFPLNSAFGQSVNVFDPNLHMPYIESWSVGVQRQLGPHTAVEVDYVGNHGVGLWQQLNLNEVNIFQPGASSFLNEFKQAQANLAACNNVPACAASPSFADQGLAGQGPVPIMTAAFNTPGYAGSGQSASDFSTGSFINDLQNGLAGTMANAIANNYTRWQNLVGNGQPSNLFEVNPDAQGGSYMLRNALQSTYNAMVIQVRHRPVHGLMLDASYTWSHSLTNDWQRNGSNSLNEITLRDPSLMKGPAPFDIRNAFKLQSLWNLPFGKGERWANGGGFLNNVVGGWAFDSNILLQSGRPGLITGGLGGTFNQYDGGVALTGLTTQSLQSQLGIYKTTTPAPGAVWYVPQALLGPNGQKSNTAQLAPCGTPGTQCSRLFLYDAPFFMPDLSLVKDTQLTERVGLNLQFQFLDAFNNANFFWTGAAETFGTAGANLSSNLFGRVTHAYSAPDSTSETGGRTIQIVARLVF
jgi:hypothetical protein